MKGGVRTGKNAYVKTVLSTIKDNLGRFFAIAAIIALGVAFVGGLGTLAKKMEASLGANLTEQRVADLIVKGTSEAGLSEAQIEAIAQTPGVESTVAFTMLDFETEEGSGEYYRVYLLPDPDALPFNTLFLEAGRAPVVRENGADGLVVEGWAERPSVVMPVYKTGDRVTLRLYGLIEITLETVGIAGNPLVTFRGGEPNQLEAAAGVSQTEITPLKGIFYLDRDIVCEQFGLTELPLPVTDIWVKCEGARGDAYFDSKYIARANAWKQGVEEALGEGAEAQVLTLEQNASWQVVKSYSKKIKVIALIFPVFFIAVAALVVLTTVTRMAEEERGIIGCYKTLGFGDGAVAAKYLFFSGMCCFVGCAVGLVLGFTVLPMAIFPAFRSILFLRGAATGLDPTEGIIAALGTTVVILALTVYIVYGQLKGTPALLLKPKAPKPGKKVWLQKIPFIWNPLPFRFKSTVRNLFRHKRHLIMTVVSVAGSSALVLAGFGLLDVWSNPDAYAFGAGMEGAFKAISAVVILFAVALCVLVIYHLTNMNIGERRREIATLKVLGYHDPEVAGYIYREILIMALFGVPVGLLGGFFLLMFAFSYLEFGSVFDVNWYSYIYTVLVVLASVALVDLLLYRKLRDVDMTGSLKTVE